MLSWFNGSDADDPGLGGQGWLKYKRTSQVLNPGPAMTMVFLDERCDSINDGEWCTSMYGWPDKPTQWKIIDFPASYHCGSGGISFVDGHSEIHKWRASLTKQREKQVLYTDGGDMPGLLSPAAGDQDIHWMSYHGGRVSTLSY